MRHLALVGISAFALCGCTTKYAPLYSPSAMSGFDVVKTNKDQEPFRSCLDPTEPIKQTLACADVLQAVYSDGYKQSADFGDLAQLPIIGAAGAAAWILLKGKDGAAKKVGKIGIGAGVYSATQGQLLPTEIAPSFIKGHAALGCIIAQGDAFSGTNAAAAASDLNSALARVGGLRELVAGLRYANVETNPDEPAEAELLQSARALADQALSQSATQLEESSGQLGAYKNANGVFRKAVTDVAAWVASRGRVRPNASYADLVSRFQPAPDTDAAIAVAGGDNGMKEAFLRSRSTNAAVTTESLARLTTALATETIRLKGVTPNYRGALTSVAQCPPTSPVE